AGRAAVESANNIAATINARFMRLSLMRVSTELIHADLVPNSLAEFERLRPGHDANGPVEVAYRRHVILLLGELRVDPLEHRDAGRIVERGDRPVYQPRPLLVLFGMSRPVVDQPIQSLVVPGHGEQIGRVSRQLR